MGKIGMYTRYNKKDVFAFFDKITELKKETPELFKKKGFDFKAQAA
jgi:hypothetical protein